MRARCGGEGVCGGNDTARCALYSILEDVSSRYEAPPRSLRFSGSAVLTRRWADDVNQRVEDTVRQATSTITCAGHRLAQGSTDAPIVMSSKSVVFSTDGNAAGQAARVA